MPTVRNTANYYANAVEKILRIWQGRLWAAQGRIIGDMAWQVFEAKGHTALGHLPKIGVHTGGRLSLNDAAFEALNRPTHVLLLFDPQTHRIGFSAADEEQRLAYPIRRPPKTSRYYVSAAAFARHYDTDPTKTYYVDAEMDGDILAGSLAIGPSSRAAPAVGGEPASGEASGVGSSSERDVDPHDLDMVGSQPAPPADAIDPDDVPF